MSGIMKSICILTFLCIVLYNTIFSLQLKKFDLRQPDPKVEKVEPAADLLRSNLPKKTSNNAEESQIYKVNRTMLKEVCKQKQQYLQQEVFTKNFESWILIPPKHKIAYCRLAKVGNQAWKTYLIPLISNQKMREKVLKLKSNGLPLPLNTMNNLFSPKNVDTNHRKMSEYLTMEKYFTFVFVRHPLDRLVSAYSDKLLRSKPVAQFKNYLVKNYGQVNFQNFLRMVLTSMDKCNSQTTTCFNSNINIHWQPYYQLCEFCDVEYDYIGRIETFNHDVQEVLIQANLTEYIPLQNIKLVHQSTTMSKSQFEVDENGIQAKELTKQYFKNVEQSIVKQIIQYYELDFLLFQYSTRDILK